MIPPVVVHHQKLRVVDAHVLVGTGDVRLGFRVGGDVLCAPVLVVKAADYHGRVRAHVHQHAHQLGPVVFAAKLAGAVRARHLYPEQQPDLVRERVDARIDPRDVHPHQVAPQLLHGVHVPFHLREGGGARLVQDAVQIQGLVVQVHRTSP